MDLKRIIIIIILILYVLPTKVFSQKGCCSWHGGVAGCSENGRQICNDGTLSPSCTCTSNITYKNVSGCTDSSAKNYNPDASINDGSCKYEKNDLSGLLLITGGTLAGIYYFKNKNKTKS